MSQQFLSKTMWGLLLIGAGVLFLLDQIGIIQMDIGTLVGFWPVILIYFGLKGVLIQRKLHYGWGGSYIWNLFIMLIGVYFLLDHLDVEFVNQVSLWQFIVPVVLIMAGFSMLTRPNDKRREERAAMREQHRMERAANREARRSRRRGEAPFTAEENPGADRAEPEPEPVYDPAYTRKIEMDLDQAFQERVVKKLGDDPFPLVSDVEAESKGRVYQDSGTPPQHEHVSRKKGMEYTGRRGGTIERFNFIGDVHLGQDYWELEPTQVSHFIGDTVIDLTKANIPYGETPITVSAFIGDVKVFVPNDIQVDVSVTASAFIGDMKVLDRNESGLFKHMKYDTPHYGEAEKKIVLTVSMFIGDVFVKRVG